MNPHRLRFALLVSALLVTSLKLSAQEVPFNWDGGGSSDSSGDWMTGSNWSADAVPANTSTSVAGLVNVTSGTRTITINDAETATAKRLLFTQTTAGAFNILSIASGGTLQLGGGQTWAAPTAGTSRVDLGGTIDFTGLTSGSVTVNTDLTFTNAGAVFRSSNTNGNPVFNFNGAVNVNAGVGTAQITYTGGNRPITTTFGATSILSINSGTLEISTPAYSSNPGITVSLGGTTTLASGTRLNLITDNGNNAAGGSAGILLTNSGALNQAGTVLVNSRGSGGTTTLTNSGTWKVNGLGAVIEKGNRATAANPTFVNTATGVFTGATSADKLDYNHLQTPGTDLAFTNSGVIGAGNGSNGSGLSSVGTLTLVDFAITNSVTTSSLVFDIGGTTAGQFDVLVFQSGSLALTNATLAINLVNGFAPGSSFSVDILTSDVPASITGSFVGLTVNGIANADYSFAYNDTTGVGTLTYTSSIPEPSTYAIVAGLATLGLAAFRRRNGKAST